MYLTAMTHREELFQLTLRWLNNTFDPEDGKNITKIFTYESGISSLIIERILDLLTKTFAGPLQTKRVRTKRELRDQIISKVRLHGARFDELKLCGRYLPEEIAAMKCALHDNSVDGGLLSTFSLDQDSQSHFCQTNSMHPPRPD